jgi:hypothetical protein
MRKFLLLFLFFFSLFLFSSYVSAQNFSDIFRTIDLEFLSLLLVFVIFSVFIAWILNRTGIFRDAYGNPTTATTVVSAAMAALIVIGWYRQGIDISYFFINVGIPTDSLYLFFSVVILVGLIFLIFRFGLGGVLFFGGVFLLAINYLTDFFYEKSIIYVVGFLSAFLGLLIWNKSRKRFLMMGYGFGRVAKRAGGFVKSRYSWEKEKRQAKSGWPLMFLGVLVVVLGVLLKNVIVVVVGILITIIGYLSRRFV